MSTVDHNAIEREVRQLQLARIGVDYLSHDGAVALAASHAREAELWREVVHDRSTAPLLCTAAMAAWTSAEGHARFWADTAAEKDTAGRPA